MQIIVMTSSGKKYEECLEPFMYLWSRHFTSPALHTNLNLEIDQVICGFQMPNSINFYRYGWRYETIGNANNYPANRWSDALLWVLNNVARGQFLLMLEDYWLSTDVDILGITNLFNYAKQFNYLLKADVTTDRLYASPEQIVDYGKVGHLDIIRSLPGTAYQFSLWGGIWNRDQMRKFVIPGESAQQLEMRGTERVNKVGDEVLVIGTKQPPLIHGNIWQSGKEGPVYKCPHHTPPRWEINKGYLEHMGSLGIWGR